MYSQYCPKVMNPLYKKKIKRVFLHPSKINKHLYCCICQDVFNDPVRTQCGHTFCYICIQQWATLKKHCPICKAKFGNRELERDLLAIALVDDLQVQCIHVGCTWKGVESVRNKHQRHCTFKPKVNNNPPQKNQKNTMDVDQPTQDKQVASSFPKGFIFFRILSYIFLYRKQIFFGFFKESQRFHFIE